MTDEIKRPTPAAEVRDRDRDRVIEQLHGALGDGVLTLDQFEERTDLAEQATTRAQLVVLTEDLNLPAVIEEPGAASPAGAPSTALAVVEPEASTALAQPLSQQQKHFALFGSNERKGNFVVARKVKATAIFGSVELDLREATFQPGVTHIHCISAFGSVELELPSHVRVEASGVGIFGSFEDRAHVPPELDDDSPVVRITGRAVFGSVETDIKKPKKKKRKKRKRRDTD